MTYFDIHTLFMLIPIAAFGRHWRLQEHAISLKKGVGGILVLALLASLWTMPWDNLMVIWGVWTYPENVVVGHVFYIPLEEQIFFIVQPFFTGLWFLLLFPSSVSRPSRLPSPWLRLLGFSVAVSVGLIAFTISHHPGYLYIGSFLAWFSIPFAIQWAYGAHLLWAWKTPILVATVPTTFYLCLLDAFAIHNQVWAISDIHTTGYFLGPLPIEEVLFFLFTNLLVVQGIALLFDLINNPKRALHEQSA